MKYRIILKHCLASATHHNLLWVLIFGAMIFLQGCAMLATQGSRRYYPLPADTVQIAAKRAVSQLGFSIWREETGEFTTDWQTYSIGKKGWLFWKKEWMNRTRLTVFIIEEQPHETALNVTSETEDSPAKKDRWNVVSRPTEREYEIIRSFLKEIDQILRQSKNGR